MLMKGNFRYPNQVCLLAIFLMACLHLFDSGPVFSASSLQGDQAAKDWEDLDYWVLIRNVSIFDAATDHLTEDMSVLVIGKHIHKIGRVPLLIFDKDLTYNFNGEGRILMVWLNNPQTQSGAPESSETIKEGAVANILVIDERSLAGMKRLMAGSGWLDKQKREDLDAVKLILKDGWVIKDTLPIKRIDESRLGKVKATRQKMEQN
jgi:hypothetical protein